MYVKFKNSQGKPIVNLEIPNVTASELFNLFESVRDTGDNRNNVGHAITNFITLIMEQFTGSGIMAGIIPICSAHLVFTQQTAGGGGLQVYEVIPHRLRGNVRYHQDVLKLSKTELVVKLNTCPGHELVALGRFLRPDMLLGPNVVVGCSVHIIIDETKKAFKRRKLELVEWMK